jgi:purine-binding chemotaxis protein CheW
MSSSPSEAQRLLADGGEYLTFFIAGEEYAVSLRFVREVIPYDTVTRVPGMPEAVRGVTNLRGSVVPVVDLAILFRLKEIPITTRTCIVLVETVVDGHPHLMGLMTEEVGQVLALASGDLLASPSFGAPVRSEFLLGMAPIGKKFALVLDIQRVLSPRELLSAAVAPANPVPESSADAALDETAWDEPAPAAVPDAAPAGP